MSVIIRLQNLPWTATALDIRRFFHGLSIPDGGVHIVGGEKGDAFIAFSTDEDARQAMMNDGGKVNNSIIKLFLSSKSEMQNIISVARAPSQGQIQNRDPYASQSAPPRNTESEVSSQGPSGYGQNRQRESRAHGKYSNVAPGGSRSSVSPSHWDSRQQEQFRKSSPSRSRTQGPGNYDREKTAERSVFVRNAPAESQHYDRDRSPPPSSYRNERASQNVDRSRSFSKDPRGSEYERGGPPVQKDFNRETARSSGYGRNGGPPRSYSAQDQDCQRSDYDYQRRGNEGMPSSYRHGSSRDGYRDDYREQAGSSRIKHRENSPVERGKYRDDNHDNSLHSQGREGRPEGQRGRGVYMYIHNMPESVSYKEVRRYFSGCEIPRDGLKLINDRDGNRNGTGYIKFISETACEEAFRLNGQFMGNKPVKLARCSAEEFNMALDSYVPKDSDGASPRHSWDGQDYPPKRLRSYSPSPRRGSPPRKRAYSPGFVPHEGYCVILDNLPVKVEREEIRGFFEGLRITRGGVYVEYDRDGRTMGNGYVEFLTERDREEALRQHKQILNGSALEIYGISKDEMVSRMNHHRAAQKSLPKLRERRDSSPYEEKQYHRDSRPGPPPRGPPPPHGPPFQRPPLLQKPPFQPEGERKYYVARLQGLPYDVTEQDIKKFFSGLAIAAQGIHIVYNVDGRCNGVGFVQFVTSTDCEEACNLDMEYMGKRYIRVQFTTKKDMYAELKQPSLNERPPAMNMINKPRGCMVFKGIPNVGDEACIIGCRNVPYRATIRDMVDFFQDFHPDEDSVRLHYDDTGKPTGDAVIAFHDSEDAKRAVDELNQCPMYGRNISVQLL